MKKTLKMILAMSLVLAMAVSMMIIPVGATTQRTLVMTPSVTLANPGDTVTVDISMVNTLGLNSLGFTLLYDKDVFELDTDLATTSPFAPKYVDSVWAFDYDDLGSSRKLGTCGWNANTALGEIYFVGTREGGISTAVANMVFSKFNFKVKANAPTKTAVFSLKDTETLDAGDMFGIAAVNSSVNVEIEGTTTIEDAYVVLTGADVEEGEEVAVSVEFGAIDNLRSGKLMVSYDPDLLTYDDYVVNPAIGGNLSFVVDDTVSGELYITFAFTDTTVDASSSFKVMDLIFITAEVDADESTSVVVSDAMFGNGTASYPVDNIQAANMSSALVGILNKVEEDYLLGDVTMDGEIDSNDAQWVLKWLLLSPAEQADDTNPDYLILKQRKAADMDKDGTITIDDVVAILKYEIAGMK